MSDKTNEQSSDTANAIAKNNSKNTSANNAKNKEPSTNSSNNTKKNNKAANNTTANNAKKNNTSGNNSKAEGTNETSGSLNSHVEKIVPILSTLEELRGKYNSASDEDKKKFEEEFNSAREEAIGIQSKINEEVEGMKMNSNIMTYMTDKFPEYVNSLKKMNLIKNGSGNNATTKNNAAANNASSNNAKNNAATGNNAKNNAAASNNTKNNAAANINSQKGGKRKTRRSHRR